MYDIGYQKSIAGAIGLALMIAATAGGASLRELAQARIGTDPASTRCMPKWSGGSLLLVENQGGQLPVISPFERTGAPQQSVLIAIPGAQTVWVRGYSHGADGTIAASGEAFDNDGRVGRFVVIFPPGGKAAQLIRTGQYYAHDVAVASDGTVWTAGIEALDRKPPGSKDASAAFAPFLNSAIIRHFDAQGNLIKSFLPQSAGTNFGSPVLEGTFLVANGTSVAWYCASEGRYLELTPQGIALDVKGVQIPIEPTGMSGFALTTGGRVFLSSDSAGHSALHEFKKGSNAWVPVAVDSSFEGLFGSDGDNLVTRTHDRFVVRFMGVSD